MFPYVEPGSFVWRVFDQYISGLVLGAIFVYVASFVAPHYKKTVAICSAGFVLILAGFLLFPSILAEEYWAMFEIVCMVIGACAVAYYVFFQEITFGP